jgi:molybdopterin-synthase adenylyltransferase
MYASSERYQRHTLIPGFSQERLAAAHLLVVGAGAIGNEVIKNLVLLGVGSLTIVDFDQAQEHNLPRSVLLRLSDVGQTKTAAVAARARELEPAVQITALHGDVRDLIGLSQLKTFDAVIAAVDNIEARLWLNQLAWLAQKPFVNAAIDHRFITVERYPFHLATDDVGCYECHLPNAVYERLAERYSCGGLARAAQEQRTIPTTTITASMAGAHASWQALAMIGAIPTANDPARSMRSFTDSYIGHANTIQLGMNMDCLGCATTRGHNTHSAFSTLRLGGKRQVAASSLTRFLAQEQQRLPQETLGLELSEAIITAAHCVTCGHQRREVVGDCARRYDERLIICAQCQYKGVQVELAHTLMQDELNGLTQLGLPIHASFAKLLNADGECLHLLDFSGTS